MRRDPNIVFWASSLGLAGTFKCVWDVGTRVGWKDISACFEFGIGVVNETPEVSESDCLVPKAGVGVADARRIGFQVASGHSSKALWNLSDS